MTATAQYVYLDVAPPDGTWMISTHTARDLKTLLTFSLKWGFKYPKTEEEAGIIASGDREMIVEILYQFSETVCVFRHEATI